MEQQLALMKFTQRCVIENTIAKSKCPKTVFLLTDDRRGWNIHTVGEQRDLVAEYGLSGAERSLFH